MKTIEQLQQEKRNLMNEVKPLIAKKKKLYSNMDIESAMSNEEKQLSKQISSIFSDINTLQREINKLKAEL